jgi:signal transduction histidine kinase
MFLGTRDLSDLLQEVTAHEGINPSVLSGILAGVFEHVQEIACQLRLDLDRERDLLGLLEKANRSLGEISQKLGGLPSFETLGGDRAVVEHTLQAVAHEIRNPLLALGGFAKRLATALDPSSEGGRYAKIILDEALRLEKALGTLSGLARQDERGFRS